MEQDIQNVENNNEVEQDSIDEVSLDDNQKIEDLDVRQYDIDAYDFDYDLDGFESLQENKKNQIKDTLMQYKQLSHSFNINPEISKQLFDFYNEQNQKMIQQSLEELDATKENVANTLKNEYGDNYNNKMNDFENGLKNFFNNNEKLVEAFKNVCSVDIEAVNSFIKYGEKLNNNLVSSKHLSSKKITESADALNNRLKEIYRDPNMRRYGTEAHNKLLEERRVIENKLLKLK